MSENQSSTSTAAMNVYCTLFDSNYLLKGAVMIESLQEWSPGAVIYVLCMDHHSFDLLAKLNWPRVRLLRLDDVEDSDLRRVKQSRSAAEYCWTLSACLCSFVMNACPEGDLVTYLDADLMFYSSVSQLFAEMADASVSIIEHRYSTELAPLAVNGRFNVQWVVFRRDAVGLDCLARWRAQCIEWCHAWLDDGRFGDQKYLEEWPDRYGASVHILVNPGAGVAPWNLAGARVTQASDGTIRVNDAPLVFYHFHQLQLTASGTIDPMPQLYRRFTSVPTIIYAPYAIALKHMLERVRGIDPTFSGGIRSSRLLLARRLVRLIAPAKVKSFLRRIGVQPW